jgi:primosomal protein N' (replication factor Y)
VTVFAEVVFPLPVDRAFHYRVPESLLDRVRPGCRVLAPFGRRTMTGFVVAVVADVPAGEFDIKDVKDVLDADPSFSEGFLAFAKRLGERSFVPWGEILQAALPPALVQKEKRTARLTASGREAFASESLTGRDKELAGLLAGGAATPGSLAKRLGLKDVGPLLKRLEGKGTIEVRAAVPRPRARKPAPVGPRSGQLDLDFARDIPPALTAIEAKVAAGGGTASCYLFGPAPVRQAAYGRLVSAAVGRGAKVLFLTPEVSRVDDLKERAAGWPGVRAAVIHSRLPRREREEEWRALLEGRANLAVGPRSALLAPLDGLALIIVDEEHDDSYAQQDGQLYDARRGACLRAEEENAAIVFGSSTPSVEAYHRAREAGTLVSLKGPAPRFRTSIVDDRGDKSALSGALLERIKRRLDRGDPVILFVNRRGYAPAVYCPACGYSPRCPRCDIAVSYHKKRDQWVCHYCNSALPASPGCPKCGAGLVRRRAKGIEAAEEELRRAFPGARPARFDTDDAAREKDRDRIVDDFRRGRIRILLGTSLLAHRADVPPAPLVGVIAPEALLGLADYRAGQRAFQSVARMRAFAEDDARAEVVIQTSEPGHFVMRAAAAGDFPAFFEAEIESRRALGYPPFTSLAEVVLQGRDLRTLARKSREFAAALGKEGEAIDVLGPALASVSRARGSYRIQIILKAKDGDTLERTLRRALERTKAKTSVRLSW